MKDYECIKSFSIPNCDGDGFILEEESIVNDKTVWFIPEDEDYRLIGGEIRLENDDFGWIEISKEMFKECFKEFSLSPVGDGK